MPAGSGLSVERCFSERHADWAGEEDWSPDDRDAQGHELDAQDAKKSLMPGKAERAAVRELVRAARARGEDLTGPDGLLKSITKTGA